MVGRESEVDLGGSEVGRTLYNNAGVVSSPQDLLEEEEEIASSKAFAASSFCASGCYRHNRSFLTSPLRPSCVFVCRLCSWLKAAALVRTVLLTCLFRAIFVFLVADRRRAATRALLESSPDTSAEAVAALNQRRAELQAERLQVKKDLKNENRRRKRLLVKAKGLAEEDLVDVMIMKAQAKAKAKASAS